MIYLKIGNKTELYFFNTTFNVEAEYLLFSWPFCQARIEAVKPCVFLNCSTALTHELHIIMHRIRGTNTVCVTGKNNFVAILSLV